MQSMRIMIMIWNIFMVMIRNILMADIIFMNTEVCRIFWKFSVPGI